MKVTVPFITPTGVEERDIPPDTVVVLENGRVREIVTTTRNQVVAVLDYDDSDNARMNYQAVMRDLDYERVWPNSYDVVPHKVYIRHDDTEHLEDGKSYGVGVYEAETRELIFRVYGPSVETAEHTATFLAKTRGWTEVTLEEVDNG